MAGEELLQKAKEHWAGALSEQSTRRFSTAVALAYYACFQTVLAEHIRRGLPPDRGDLYSHGLVYRTAEMLLKEREREDLTRSLPLVYNARIDAQYTGTPQTAEGCATIMTRAAKILAALEVT